MRYVLIVLLSSFRCLSVVFLLSSVVFLSSFRCCYRHRVASYVTARGTPPHVTKIKRISDIQHFPRKKHQIFISILAAHTSPLHAMNFAIHHSPFTIHYKIRLAILHSSLFILHSSLKIRLATFHFSLLVFHLRIRLATLHSSFFILHSSFTRFLVPSAILSPPPAWGEPEGGFHHSPFTIRHSPKFVCVRTHP